MGQFYRFWWENRLYFSTLTLSCRHHVVNIVQMCECVFLVGRIDDGDWNTESSYVCIWNLDRRGLNPKQADLVIDVPTAVTALCCHPNQPALVAGTLSVCGVTSQTDNSFWMLTESESGQLKYEYLI